MGFMNMFGSMIMESMLKGVATREQIPLIKGLLGILAREPGGITAWLQRFESQGLGEIVQSWISTGPNMPITPDQLRQGVGADALQEVADKAGSTEPQTTEELAQLLPGLIDKLSPDGHLNTARVDQVLQAMA